MDDDLLSSSDESSSDDDITGAASMLSERLGVEVTQECIQDVWAACFHGSKRRCHVGRLC